MIPWTDSVRQSRKLTIYIGSLAGSWAHVFRQALHEFNVLVSAHKLGVTITECKSRAEDEAGANVSVKAVDGVISASYAKESQSEDFDGKRLHGRTLLFS